jgi:hypothetical protein
MQIKIKNSLAENGGKLINTESVYTIAKNLKEEM